jgi:U-box domain
MVFFRPYGRVEAHEEQDLEGTHPNHDVPDITWENADLECSELRNDTEVEHDDNVLDLEESSNSHDCRSTTSVSTEPFPSQRPPTNFYCPISLRIMQNPVLDNCGHCFDRDSITTWLDIHTMCPISRKPLQARDLIEAVALKERIHRWKERHPPQGDSSEPNFVRSSKGDPLSQFNRMLLPQERKVLSIVKFRNRVRAQQEKCSQCTWAVLMVFFVVGLAIAFTTIYVFHVEFRGPL